MSKVAKKTSKIARTASKKGQKRVVKSRALRKLQKSRPKRYMNPFFCFMHEERKKAKEEHLLPAWRTAHKGLGSQWIALGAGRARFKRHGKVPAFQFL